ncbi:hypothetical protein SCP_1402840 [Sparassis crispa]|uniref:Uncharacterized protein n=1 Tax=Sparassis crispa TaxID=139825 RepID=A0A401H358_9APHY|nr:hypothetical protein SCP_1402840 [Sparassis crispa]GBE88876.1 hypothetical protein SCP_1402840 [Sparassis crispa]
MATNEGSDIIDRMVPSLQKEFGTLEDASGMPAPYAIAALVTGDPQLPQKYGYIVNAKELCLCHPELVEMLKEAFLSGDFRKFGSTFLRIVQPKPVTPVTPTYSLRNSFRTPYAGAAVDGLYEYLRENNRKFHSQKNYYAKFCSIVQSSGTGKSRTVVELGSKGVMVLYINVRNKTDKHNWPTRDDIPASILAEDLGSLTEESYTHRCCAFFTAIFRHLDEHLQELFLSAGKDISKTIELWRIEMDGTRGEKRRVRFFREVEKVYNEIMDADSASVEELTENLSAVSISEPTQKELTAEKNPDGLPDYETRLRTAYASLIGTLENLMGTTDDPKLVVAIDEAHCLSTMVNDNFRPSHLLCRAISAYSCVGGYLASVWVVFASTNSRIADFSAPSHIHDSQRVVTGGARLFPPYTLTGWDQNAAPLAGITNADDVSRAEHIIRYGRPLWYSSRTTDYTYILDLASEKLCKSLALNINDSNQILAVLGQRFCLDVCFGHPEAVEFLETGVASHLRICEATTEDRMWRFTSYPSEPILSHVAGCLLHSAPGYVVDALKCMEMNISNGMIEVGKSGELVSRIIWILGKDFLLHQLYNSAVLDRIRNPYLLYCRKVPLTKYLETCFGLAVWPDDEEQANAAKNALQNAYVNFSHWVSMVEDICDESRRNWCAKQWLLRHWARTAAVQCCHNQPLVDKVIPIYFQKTGRSLQDSMSLIMISDKAGANASPTDVNAIQAKHASINCVTALPSIAVTLDMGIAETKVRSTFPTRRSPRADGQHTVPEIEDPANDLCLRIYATGMNAKTFPFLEEKVGLETLLRSIVQHATAPKYPHPVGEHLRDQMKYGSSSRPRHMEWENGAKAPDELLKS